MQEIRSLSKEELEEKALELAQQKKQWHYHLLTPTCKFNDKEQHAFVLENNSNGEYFAFYSDEPAMDLGKKLLNILHGWDIIGGRSQIGDVSKSTQEILSKARELNREGKFWHHHVFFSNCIFNKHLGMWNITFEDQQAGTILESLSVKEPKADQKEVETLYYLQKTIV